MLIFEKTLGYSIKFPYWILKMNRISSHIHENILNIYFSGDIYFKNSFVSHLWRREIGSPKGWLVMVIFPRPWGWPVFLTDPSIGKAGRLWYHTNQSELEDLHGRRPLAHA